MSKKKKTGKHGDEQITNCDNKSGSQSSQVKSCDNKGASNCK